MVVFALAARSIVGAIKRTCQLFMYFSFLVAPSGRDKREHGVEAVKEKERCSPPPVDSILAQEVFPSASVGPLWE